MALERLAHTCAVVLAYKFQPAHAVRITGLAEAAAHPSAGVIVFDGVANDVLADLPQIQRVACESFMLQRQVHHHQRNACSLRLGARNIQHLVQLACQTIGGLSQRLLLRAIQRQHVVYQRQQIARRGLRLLPAGLHQRHILRVPPDDLQHTHDDVDGCAYVVAHAAKEVRLGLVRRCGTLYFLFQLLLVRQLPPFAVLAEPDQQQCRHHRRQRVHAEGGDQHILCLREHKVCRQEHIQAVLLVSLPCTEERAVRAELGQLAARGGGGLQRTDEGHLVHRQVPLLRRAAAHHALAVGDVGVDPVIEQRLVARQQALDGRTVGGDDRVRLEADAEDDAGIFDARHGCYVVYRAVTGQAAGEDLFRVVHDGADRLIGVVIAPVHVRTGAELDLQILVQHQHAGYALTLGVPRQLLVGAVLPHHTLALRHLLRLLRQPHEAL